MTIGDVPETTQENALLKQGFDDIKRRVTRDNVNNKEEKTGETVLHRYLVSFLNFIRIIMINLALLVPG